MENKKKLLIGLLILWCVLGCSIGGFFVGKMMKNVDGKKEYGPLEELTEVLIANHYSSPTKEDLLLGAINGMTESLNDPYTYYYTYNDTKASTIGLGLGITIKNGQVVVTSVASTSEANAKRIFPGDVIEYVDSKKVSDMTMSELSNALTKNSGETVEITFKRGEIVFSTIMEFTTMSDAVLTSKVLEDNIGYIKIKSFDSEAVSSFIAALSTLEEKNIMGLIIDVRDNPGGTLSSVNDILRLFLTGNQTYLRMETVKQTDESKRNEYYRPYSSTVKKTYDIKILINERSASAAEVFALAMNLVEGYDLIGENSYGKSVFQTDYKMETMENCYLHITLGNWYGPNETTVKNGGITPTYNIKIADNYYAAAPNITNNINYDSVDIQTKNIQLMLKTLGYEVRCDGYFDLNMQNVLNVNYGSMILTADVAKEIYDDYLVEIQKIIYDTQLSKAISLLKEA